MNQDELIQAPTTPTGRISVLLPCNHQRAYLHAATDTATRQCRTCREHYLIEYQSGDVAKVTDVTCFACGSGMRWVDDQWYCPGCGNEYAARAMPTSQETEG